MNTQITTEAIIELAKSIDAMSTEQAENAMANQRADVTGWSVADSLSSLALATEEVAISNKAIADAIDNLAEVLHKALAK